MYHKIIPIISCLFFSINVYCQQTRDRLPVAADSTKAIYSKVEVEASFPGGNPAWIKYLQKKLDPLVPVRNGAPAGHYVVVVRFIVSTDGSLSKVVAETNHGFGMEDELRNIIKRGPKWIPATQDGVPVNACRRQPITFVVGGR
jgi:protein TonB